MKNFIIKSGDIRLAEGVIFTERASVARLFYCNSPFLLQQVFNKEELIQYYKDNSTAKPEIIQNLQFEYVF